MILLCNVRLVKVVGKCSDVLYIFKVAFLVE